MRVRFFAAIAVALTTTQAALSIDLFTEDFDTDPTANWVLNPSNTDAYADFFFDYSTVGIPAAPNSTGGSTRGAKIQANLVNGVFGGGSVSPIGQSFTGDYKLTFDYWGNYVGDPSTGLATGGQGQTNMSTYGIMTDGETGVSAGIADGVWFAATIEGGSSADYRAYSIERAVSYQLPPNTDIDGDMVPDSMDGLGQPIDGHAHYLARSRNNAPAPADFNDNGIMDAADYVVWRENLGLTTPMAPGPLRTSGNADFDLDVDQADYATWASLFGSTGLYRENFGGVEAPAAQLALYSQQTGMTPVGTLGMEWHEMEISKVGNIVEWRVDGVLLITLDMTNFVTLPDGDNIFFGHADINNGSSLEPDAFDLLFTLIDNVKVTTIPPGSGAVAGSVPEPSAMLLVVLGIATAVLGRRRY